MSVNTTSSLPKFNHNIGNTIKPKTAKPSIPKVVTTTIKKNETPMSDEHFSLMKAAKQAGLPTNEQKKFADANADGKMSWTKGNDPTPKDNSDVKAADYKGLVGKQKSLKLGEQQVANLKQQVKEYVAKGGKLYSNQEVLNNPNQTIAGKNGIATPNANTPNVGETSSIIPLGNEPKTRFSVLLNNDGKPITNERVLTQFIEDRYQGGNLWGENYNQIANMSIAQGAKADNINIKGNVGNKTAVYFEVSVKDQVKIHENYKIVQSQINEIDKLREKYNQENPLSQFILGTIDGAWDSVKGNANVILHPLETINGIKDAVTALASLSLNDLENIKVQLKDEIVKLATTKEGINSLPHKAGYVVGMAVAEIITAKGVGAVLEGVKTIPAIKGLLSKVDDLKLLTKAKIAEKFSDNAASLASQRIKQALQNPALYNGVAGAELLKDYAVVAGNRISNGAVKFADFSKRMVDDFGDRVKPYVEKLYREQMIELNLADKIDEIGIKSTKLDKIKQIPDAILDPPKGIRNKKMAGKNHPVTGVYFDRNGYPVFNSKFDVKLSLELRGNSVSDHKQFKDATRQLKNKIESNPALRREFTAEQLKDIFAEEEKIVGLTWHHHQDGVRLQLVDEWTHAKTGHDGGRKNTGGRP
jgi:DNase/tRNase domain of colicin-like bacteriocin